ncbi:potassium/sodium eff [Durotheca rogersii]|uniref:potassium/sodium eff n=1 Tax=Durotheca rogersii TaxID=419775 RepID=UPI002220A837|nr:potassium/sodium eff [Durotheca rogersii]KAI5856138.1 potassium/sodium eff [Durotheca rogersii]
MSTTEQVSMVVVIRPSPCYPTPSRAVPSSPSAALAQFHPSFPFILYYLEYVRPRRRLIERPHPGSPSQHRCPLHPTDLYGMGRVVELTRPQDQITVEESTEPPICGYTDAASNTPPGHKTQDITTTTTASVVDRSKSPADEKGASSYVEGEDGAEPHTLSAGTLEKLLETDIRNGLAGSEAAHRLEQDGPNRVEGAQGLSVWKILLRQVSNSLTIVLILVMALSFAINDFIEGGVIAAVIALNIVVGLVQDYRAEQTIQSLYALSAPTCKVVRSEQSITVKAESLVKGDIVLLNVGDIVPADLRLVDGLNLSTDEALLTGESLPISKHPEVVLHDADIPLGDRINMLYSASVVTRGRGKGIVVATGMATEVGKIAQLLRANPDPGHNTSRLHAYWGRVKASTRSILGLDGTPLQVQLSKFALLLFALAILLAIIVFSASLWNVDDEVLIYGICVGVAVIPESLIAVLTISMAVGTKAMAKGNVIVRKLSALEAVGGVTNICSDKTGTLTQGKMIARRVWLRDGSTATVEGSTHPFDPSSGAVIWNCQTSDSKSELESTSQLPLGARKFIECLSLCNNATVTDGKSAPTDDTAETSTTSTAAISNWTAVGEPTEIALQVFAMRFGLSKSVVAQTKEVNLYAEHPFDSSCKRMTVVYSSPGSDSVEVYTKGALEVVLPLLNATDDVKAEFTAKAESLAAEGLRVLCIAHKTATNSADLREKREAAESGLTPLGLAGLYDPPRVETADAVRRCKIAGISVHMLTGDHIKTATAIAREVGILGDDLTAADAANAVMPAAAFDALSDPQIDQLEKLPLVLARCSPSTKVRMVEAMHRRGAFCVMTGDGVNDSPALKKADVGIAMGLNGSDVAKEAADMVLTDDNFASIVTAVEEGRRLFDNIQKFLLHLLISNIAQVLLLLIGLAFKDMEGKSIFPLSPIEILWANLITSSFLALGLGLEEAQPDIMLRPPHDLRIGVFTKEIILDKMAYGFFMGSLCIASFTSVIYTPMYNLYSPTLEYNTLGHDCNAEYSSSCDNVFRARATTYATLSFLLLFTAWEVKHFTRSLFNMYPETFHGPFSVFKTVWKNRFLFGAVVAGFLITFPVVYLPVINRIVFKHQSIGVEWAIVFICVVVYIALVEIWKAGKRRFGRGITASRQTTAREA